MTLVRLVFPVTSVTASRRTPKAAATAASAACVARPSTAGALTRTTRAPPCSPPTPGRAEPGRTRIVIRTGQPTWMSPQTDQVCSAISALWPDPSRRRRGRPGSGTGQPGVQRTYSSPVSYSVNSELASTSSAMPNSWNAGKSCSAAHRSWCARDCHTVTTCRLSWSEPAAQASRPSMSCGALCLAETARKSSMVRPFDLLMWTYPMTVLPFLYQRVCAGRKDATGTRESGHPGKYSAEYSFTRPRGDLAAVAEAELDQD